MTNNIATALADVMAAAITLDRMTQMMEGAKSPPAHYHWKDRRADASRAMENALDEYTVALEQHIKAEIIRAVASMPGHTTEQGVAP